MFHNTDEEILISKLKQIAILKNFSNDFLFKFKNYLQIKTQGPKEAILKEGECGRDMFLLLDGQVRVLKKTFSGDEYTAAILKSEQGIFFGEVGLLTEEKRSATIISETSVTLALLSEKSFNDLLKAETKIGNQFLLELAASICLRLQKANKDTIVLYEALMSEIGTGNLGINFST